MGGMGSRSLRTLACLRSMMESDFKDEVKNNGVLRGNGQGNGVLRARVEDGGEL
jgi:hypothetical protein